MLKRTPLTQLSLLNKDDLIYQSLLLTNKLISVSGHLYYSEGVIVGDEQNSGTESPENFSSFLQVKHTNENQLEDNASDLSTPINSPNRSSSTKHERSGILRKAIRKEKEARQVPNSFKKSTEWLKRRNRSSTQSMNTADTTPENQSSLNITYKFSPKKLLFQLMTSEETAVSAPVEHKTEAPLKSTTSLDVKEATTSPFNTETILQRRLAQARMKTKAANPADRNVYCLNDMPSIEKMQISGIKVSLGNDRHSYSFPSDRKTVKFVV